MSQPAPSHIAYIDYLHKLSERENGRQRVAFAALRAGLTNPPESVQMAPYVEKWVKGARGWWRDCYYMVGALYTLQPAIVNEGNFGDHLRLLKSPDNTAIDKRITRLLKADRSTVYPEVRSSISILASADLPINWVQLLSHMIGWNHPSRYVQKQWSYCYYSQTTISNNPKENVQ